MLLGVTGLGEVIHGKDEAIVEKRPQGRARDCTQKTEKE